MSHDPVTNVEQVDATWTITVLRAWTRAMRPDPSGLGALIHTSAASRCSNCLSQRC